MGTLHDGGVFAAKRVGLGGTRGWGDLEKRCGLLVFRAGDIKGGNTENHPRRVCGLQVMI